MGDDLWNFGETQTKNLKAVVGWRQMAEVDGDKGWAFKHWKLTLYGEVLNLTNLDNRIYVFSPE